MKKCYVVERHARRPVRETIEIYSWYFHLFLKRRNLWLNGRAVGSGAVGLWIESLTMQLFFLSILTKKKVEKWTTRHLFLFFAILITRWTLRIGFETKSLCKCVNLYHNMKVFFRQMLHLNFFCMPMFLYFRQSQICLQKWTFNSLFKYLWKLYFHKIWFDSFSVEPFIYFPTLNREMNVSTENEFLGTRRKRITLKEKENGKKEKKKWQKWCGWDSNPGPGSKNFEAKRLPNWSNSAFILKYGSNV